VKACIKIITIITLIWSAIRQIGIIIFFYRLEMDFIFQMVWFDLALATVIYIACLKTGENKTQTDIANAADMTEVTLRKRYIDLKIYLLS
jgi:hypothetical protein